MNQPNIIMIMTDQHRGDFMGCMGSKIVDTPNMDRMAEEGALFANAYCSSPLCVPSRMSMLTGRYPHKTKVYDNNDYLQSDIPTIAHALALGGYDTVLCGRMHFVGPDQRHGFAARLVGDITPSYQGAPSTPYGGLSGTAGQGLRSIQTAGPGTSPVIEYDEQVTAACERFLQERDEEDKPLFLTVGYYGPHHPYVCPPKYYERAREKLEQGWNPPLAKDEQPIHPWFTRWEERLQAGQITEEQLMTARACYAGLVSLADVHLGRVLSAVEALKRDTILIYVSDHGDMAGDRGMFWKRNFLEGAVRVPMIWQFKPGTVSSGATQSSTTQSSTTQSSTARSQARPNPIQPGRVDVPVSLIDLAPTLTQLAGAPHLPQTDGVDLSGLLSGQPQDEKAYHRPLLCEWATHEDAANVAVIMGGMKYIVYHGYEEKLLFALGEDPQEQTNVSNHPAYAKIAAEMQRIATDNWDSQRIMDELSWKINDRQFMKAWGRQVGMGPMDLWDYAASACRSSVDQGGTADPLLEGGKVAKPGRAIVNTRYCYSPGQADYEP